MSVIQALLASYAGISTPPLPAFNAGQVALVASLWNWNPVGYSAGASLNASGDDSTGEAIFNGIAPYFCDGAGFPLPDWGNPPYVVSVWDDQNSQANSLTATGSARPTLQVTTPVVVSGAGTSAANGTYTYRGQSGGKAYYNLVGQPTSATLNAIAWDADSAHWTINDSGGTSLYDDVNEVDVSFPWDAGIAWEEITGDSPAPTVTMSGSGGNVVFDGSVTGLAGAGALYSGGSAVGTIYMLFKAGSLLETSVLLETGTGAADQARRISIRLVAGVLTCSVFDATAVVCLANTKIKTISDSNWHWLAFTWDTGQGTAANQTALKVDDSATGVSSPISSTVAGLLMGNAVPNVGARNNAASAWFTGAMRTAICKNVVDNAATQTNYYNYGYTYLQSTAPG